MHRPVPHVVTDFAATGIQQANDRVHIPALPCLQLWTSQLRHMVPFHPHRVPAMAPTAGRCSHEHCTCLATWCRFGPQTRHSLTENDSLCRPSMFAEMHTHQADCLTAQRCAHQLREGGKRSASTAILTTRSPRTGPSATCTHALLRCNPAPQQTASLGQEHTQVCDASRVPPHPSVHRFMCLQIHQKTHALPASVFANDMRSVTCSNCTQLPLAR